MMREYEIIKKTSENRMPARSYYIPEKEGRKESLNGVWKFAFFENGSICYNSTNLISCFCALCLVRSLFIKDIYIKDDFCDFKDDYIKQLKYFDYRINEVFFNADNILKIDCLAYAYYIYSAKIGINIPKITKNLDQVIIHASLYL